MPTLRKIFEGGGEVVDVGGYALGGFVIHGGGGGWDLATNGGERFHYGGELVAQVEISEISHVQVGHQDACCAQASLYGRVIRVQAIGRLA
jgi:hypothetical protein